ncbi:hypothetical protein NC981_25505 [Leptolyngbya sp. DQ-M1]|uniref:hypothetical protein n=1 Tax=Leptolyngbya sp. DQ-M1 TaxID=2933920 RepID=UPI0032979489
MPDRAISESFDFTHEKEYWLISRNASPAWLEPLADRLVRYPHLADAYKHHPFQAWISLPLSHPLSHH